ncbi:MAG: DoxX family protein [Elainellaceae cyanobacterium]
MSYVALAARVFLSIIFIRSGISHLLGFSGFQQTIASQGVPLAGLTAVVTIIFLLAGGLLLLLGFKTTIGAILLIVFLVPTTLLFHNFLADPSETNAFLKNLGLIGGLLMMIYAGPGKISLDGQTGQT